MTLLRQLSLAMLALIVLVVTGSMLINLRGTQSYLAVQLATHAQDTATSLGLSLSSAAGRGDEVTVQSMSDAVFDRGAYQQLTVRDAEGQVLHMRELSPTPPRVPAWFTRLLPLNSTPGHAVVMDGWRQVGAVTVLSHPGEAYVQLWRGARESLLLFGAAGAGAMVLAWLLVGIILRPLAVVEGQAHAIAQRQFRTVERIPATRELRRVVEAMNTLTGKVRAMLDEQIALTEQARAQAYRDPVTGLANRARFNAELELLLGDAEAPPAALALVQLDGLAQLNARGGYGAGDALLAAAGSALAAIAEGYELRCAARLGGADFALLLATSDPASLERLGAEFGSALASLHASGLAPEPAVGHVGLAAHQRGEGARALLARADRALRAAQSEGVNTYLIAHAQSPALGAQDAAHILREALTGGRLRLHAQPVVYLDAPGRMLHHEVLARIETADGLLPAGVFAPGAQRFGLAQMLDRAVIETLLRQAGPGGGPALAVNLFASSVDDSAFRAWLVDQLRGAPALAARLSFEVTEYTAAGVVGALEALSTALHPLGTRIGLDHFGRGFQPFGYLATLRPHYLKVDGSHVRGVATSTDGRFFLHALIDVARSLDAVVVAEAVEHTEELSALADLGVDAAQGWHLGEPRPIEDVLAS